MFGYLDIQKDKINDGQRGLWQTFMCGLCFSTKKVVGNFPRMFITNDINFFNVLFHSILQIDVVVEHKNCFSHPIKKRTVIQTDDLTDKLALANVLLTYWNLHDDVVDGGGKRLVASIYKKYHKKSKKLLKDLDDVIAQRYEDLRKLEQSRCQSIDQVADSFALLSQDFCKIILGEKSCDYAEILCYNLGKWIYLIDALDDVKKDIKSKSYNPFVACYGVGNAKQLSLHIEEITFTMYAVLNRIAQSFNDLNLTKYHCILQNVLFDGIRDKTKEILGNITKA